VRLRWLYGQQVVPCDNQYSPVPTPSEEISIFMNWQKGNSMNELTAPQPTTARFSVSVYSGGRQVQVLGAAAVNAVKGSLWLHQQDGPASYIQGTCSAQLTEGRRSTEVKYEPHFEALLYSGGRVVETHKIANFTCDKGVMYMTDVYADTLIFAGDFIIRRIGSHLICPDERSHVKVIAYSGGEPIGTWYGYNFMRGETTLYLYANLNFSVDMIVGGTHVVVPYRYKL